MDELLDLLGQVSSGFQERLHEMSSLRELGLAPFQARLIALVGRRAGCSQRELASRTGRDKAQVARTIKELEGRGLLARAVHEADWRSQSLKLTVEGERACGLLLRDRASLGAHISSELTPEERSVMILTLTKMRDKLGAAEA